MLRTLLLMSLATSALAQERINICLDINADMKVAQTNFEEYDDRLNDLGRTLDNMRRNVRTRTRAIESRRTQLNGAEARHNSLVEKQRNKDALLAQNRSNLTTAQSALPAAEQRVKDAKKKKDDECGFFGGMFDRKCRKAKDAYDAAKRERNTLNTTIEMAQSAINELNNIDRLVATARRELDTAERNLSVEQNRTPTIAALNTEIRELTIQKREMERGIDAVEEEYVLAQQKVEECELMRYESIKAPVFKDHVVKYLDNANCIDFERDMRRVRNQAVRDGIQEAYDILCLN